LDAHEQTCRPKPFTRCLGDPNLRAAPSFVLTALSWLALAMLASPAPRAHEFAITDVLVVLRSDDTYGIDMTLDVDALALGVSPSTDSAEVVSQLEGMSAGEFAGAVERARDTLLRRVRIRFDGEKQTPWIDFPGHGNTVASPSEPDSVLGITARLTGQIPQGALEFSFGASRAFGPVQLTVLEQSDLRADRQLLEAGADSSTIRLTVRRPESSWYRHRGVMLVAIAVVVIGIHLTVRRVRSTLSRPR
jgi:hypothetical protein